MGILADMRAAIEAMQARPLAERLAGDAVWLVGGGALNALHADLAHAGEGVATWGEHKGRRELASVLGFPVVDTTAFEGWELRIEEEPAPLQPRPKRRTRK